jgi:putative CocE/NonD family hydrolase
MRCRTARATARPRATRRYPYIARHGYACVRLDLRGSGDSDGLIADEYTEQEQDDVEAVIAWLASQPWCDGSVGMIGASWGGFAALQAAARNPPALRGIVAIHASDDRYADDVPRDRKGRRMSGATRPNRGSGDAGVGEGRALKGCTDCRGNLSTLHASGSRPPVQR